MQLDTMLNKQILFFSPNPRLPPPLFLQRLFVWHVAYSCEMTAGLLTTLSRAMSRRMGAAVFCLDWLNLAVSYSAGYDVYHLMVDVSRACVEKESRGFPGALLQGSRGEHSFFVVQNHLFVTEFRL